MGVVPLIGCARMCVDSGTRVALVPGPSVRAVETPVGLLVAGYLGGNLRSQEHDEVLEVLLPAPTLISRDALQT
jgi:hypothetical protein